MTGSVQTRTPRDWGGGSRVRTREEPRPVVGTIVAVLRGGSPRLEWPRRPGRHRDARFRSVILTAESMISSALLPLFFQPSYSRSNRAVGHDRAQTTGARGHLVVFRSDSSPASSFSQEIRGERVRHPFQFLARGQISSLSLRSHVAFLFSQVIRDAFNNGN